LVVLTLRLPFIAALEVSHGRRRTRGDHALSLAESQHLVAVAASPEPRLSAGAPSTPRANSNANYAEQEMVAVGLAQVRRSAEWQVRCKEKMTKP